MTPRANVLLTGFLSLPLLWAGAPVLRASGDWLGTSTIPTDDLSSYTAESGMVTGLNLKNKPPVIQFTTEAGEVLVLVIPKTALVSIAGKLVNVNRLRVGQRAAMRWAIRDDLRVVGMLEVLPEELPNIKPMKRPTMPTVPQANLIRPPASAPLIREAAPVSPPPRPAVPSMPSLNQEIRR